MKNLLSKWMLAILLAGSCFAVSQAADAWYRCYHCGYGYYYHRGVYYRPVGNVHCKWIGGFWRHGIWHPAQKICWRR